VSALRAPLDLGPAAPPELPRELAGVFSALGPAVLGFVRASGCGDPEDVVGDVFARTARGLPRFEGDDRALRAWVFTIAYRSVIDDHRRARRQRLLLRKMGRGAPAPPPDEPFDPALVAALRQLTPDQRQVVTLRFIADVPLEEVSRVTGKPLGAVKSLQHRGLLALRTLLEPGPAARHWDQPSPLRAGARAGT
jgi:RNA polymerase sigma factor (sigma-70 family)